jgi:signal peptide peptidase SppA
MLKTLLKLVPARFRKSYPIIHVVRLEGPIMAERGLRPTLSGKSLETLLVKAFRKGIAGVALSINCPGGSPVQSALIASRIRQLAAEKNIPVYAFCEDVAASGGYWLACAADEIFADENSIVGSIGVISMGFGFPETLKKLGVERRVHTAGNNKSQLDPFQPEKPEDVERLETLLNEMHASFKALVKERRAGKLKGEESELFSGLYWRGEKAVGLGLVDGIGHLNTVMRRKFGDKVQLKTIAGASGWGMRWLGGGRSDAGIADLPDAALEALERRAWWSRFGL